MIAKSSAIHQVIIIAHAVPGFYALLFPAQRRFRSTAAMKEDVMKRFTMILLAGVLAVPTAAIAHDTETPFPTRGACESASAAMSIDERDWVLATFPDLFGSRGDVSSFLTKAFTCDRNRTDGQWYISDHIADVLGSDWYLHRH